MLELVYCSSPSLCMLLLLPAKPVTHLPIAPARKCNCPCRLGTGAQKDYISPVELKLPGGPERWRVISVAAGGRHSMVLALPDNGNLGQRQAEVRGRDVCDEGRGGRCSGWRPGRLANLGSAMPLMPPPLLASPGLLLQWSSRKPYYSPSPPQSTLGRDPSWPVLGDEEQEDGAGALPALLCSAIAPVLRPPTAVLGLNRQQLMT